MIVLFSKRSQKEEVQAFLDRMIDFALLLYVCERQTRREVCSIILEWMLDYSHPQHVHRTHHFITYYVGTVVCYQLTGTRRHAVT